MIHFKPSHRILLIAVILVAMVAISAYSLRPSDDPFQAEAIIGPPFPSLSYGIQTFLWWDGGSAGLQAAQVSRVLNFSYIKQTFPWNEIEPRQDEWDFTQSDRIVALAEEWQLSLIVRLSESPDWATTPPETITEAWVDAPPDDLADWADYCGHIAERYQGRITAYQVWNEPNLQREWGGWQPDPEAYVALLAACSDAIRAVDETAIIISAGLSPTGSGLPLAIPDDQYLDALYRHGFQTHIDVVGAHAPGFAPPAIGPDDAVANGSARWASFRRVEDLRKIMIRHGDAARQMAILEFGYTTDTQNPTYAWFAVTPDEQAQYTVAAYDYAIAHWRPWVGLMSLIYMPNPLWTEANEEWWWAIGTPDYRWRPIYFDLARMDKVCDDQTMPGWDIEWSEEEWDEYRSPCP